jgi:putative acetyltransferase
MTDQKDKTMEFTTNFAGRQDEIIDLFRSTFTDSEGAAEGDLIGILAERMLATVAPDDIFVFSAMENGKLVGTIIFTRLNYPEDDRKVFILGPVAVATGQQGKGLGQRLLNYGLDRLRADGVDVALTYGDINFYSKVGFSQITESIARPPLPLKYPDGWLGQSLTAEPLKELRGPSQCVEALNSADYW